MVKANWAVFGAKFSENPQQNFEWLCYLLFCRKFNRPEGIFRYRNQSAIETDPIVNKGETIGWQAKFYQTALGSHKRDLLNCITKAKRDYPQIQRLIIYSNGEWAQAAGKRPKGLLEIERHAKQLAIKVEWKTASFFESDFVAMQNQDIAEHFFLLNAADVAQNIAEVNSTNSTEAAILSEF